MDDDDLDRFERITKSWQRMSGLPVASDKRRTEARKKTRKSNKAAKRIGQQTSGIRRRRNRRSDG